MPDSAAAPNNDQRFSLAASDFNNMSDEDSTLTAGFNDDDDDDRSDDSYYLERRRERRKKQVVRIVAFLVANAFALCAGSNMIFSMYAPLFQSRLHYTQLQVNGAAIACSIALYMPISVLGYLCDRYGAPPLSLASGVLFGIGYGSAAAIYRNLDVQYQAVGKQHGVADGTYPLMIFAFVCIGAGTCSGYMSCVSTVAKNFGKGKYRGLALALPITCFGLSGMWLSQAGSKIFCERLPDKSAGDVDVFRFFIFLAVLLFTMGVIGYFTLRVVDEQDLIDEAIEELEHSGLLDGSSLIGRADRSYGTADPRTPVRETDDPFDPTKDDDAKRKKNWVLNAETRRFLSDHTMWPFALAFLLMIGPGEAFINNLGTVLGTLTPPEAQGTVSRNAAATQVSIFGVTSTISRLLIGTLTDLLAPSPHTQHVQLGPSRPTSPLYRRIAISRVVFLLFFAGLLAVGLLFLASGAVQQHVERFAIVSALVGAGYGAIFSLTPLIVTIIWGVENFATNFGIIATMPALGSVFWGSIYSSVYQAAARAAQSEPGDEGDDDDDIFCYGKQCYAPTFLAQGITVMMACAMLWWAWKGRGGWQQRGIII